MGILTVGIDLAKNVFAVHAVNVAASLSWFDRRCSAGSCMS